MVNPTAVRIDASSICQLKCPLCPTFRGENEEVIGRGTLKLADFKRFITDNPQIRSIELGNFGEVFLNKALPNILQYAYEQNVDTSIDEGANLNNATDEALEALVKYQTTQLRCAIDGVTKDTYQIYRVGGNLKQVLDNIQKINAYKKIYQSEKPNLIFQFIIFEHNENQIDAAAMLAKMHDMEFDPKLNWYTDVMPVANRERVRQVVGYADRKEYLELENKHYMHHQCYEMWNNPQINWDGKLLGCSRNFWGDYEENVFQTGFFTSINNDEIQYVRDILMGKHPLRSTIPCTHCSVYHSMVENDNWITDAELAEVA